MPAGFGEVSIGGVLFGVLETGQGFFPMPTQEIIEEVAHIPYSVINIVDHGGKGPNRFQATAVVLPEDRVAFEALNGEIATLVLYGTDLGEAKMKIQSATVHALLQQYRYQIEIIW